MKRMAVVTATRAEYGLLAPVITELRKLESHDFCVELIVTGTHLSAAFGMTIEEIETAGQRIDKKVEIPVGSESPVDTSVNQAEALVKFSKLFYAEKYDAVLILGDRYEMLAIAVAAGNMHIPVFHMCGGDTTEGAVDEWIRHAITKIAYLHFVSSAESRQRVVQLGEDPKRVYDTGSTSIDNLLSLKDISREKALESIGLEDGDYALCTWQPVTMGPGDPDADVSCLLKAICAFPDICFIVTKANSDHGGARINALFEEAEKEIPNLHLYSSLGMKRYLSLMKHCAFVIGNSSSGIIEAPSCHVPTVDIGERQRGRLCAGSVIHCNTDAEDIIRAVNIALSDEHIMKCKKVINPYGAGKAAPRIAEICHHALTEEKIDLRKAFYDIKN